MLEARNISKTFQSRNGKEPLKALDQLSFKFELGKTLALTGPSGCGKSTAARILLRLIPPDSGGVFFDGEDITHRRGGALRSFRLKTQYISQHPGSFFDPSRKLGYSVMEPQKIFKLYDPARYPAQLRDVLEQVKLDASLLDRYPHQVSGGEIQRLAICRALLLNPQYLILDEATSMLDVSVQAQILHILKDLQREQRIGFLFISHDRECVEWMAHEILDISPN